MPQGLDDDNQYDSANQGNDKAVYIESGNAGFSEKTDKPTPWGNDAFILFNTSSLEPESSKVNGK